MSEHEPGDYERRDLDSRMVVRFGVGLIGALFLSFIIVKGFAMFMGGGSPGAGRLVPPHSEIAGPRLQANAPEDLAEFRQAEEARLHGYGWVDRPAGVIHLPIERAMELTVERGLPSRESGKEANR